MSELKGQVRDGTEPLRICVMDDDVDHLNLAARSLHQDFPKAEIVKVTDPVEFRAVLAARQPDAIISDYELRWSNGLDLFRQVRAVWPEVPFIIFTGTGSEAICAAAWQAGVTDYLIKSPLQYANLSSVIRAAIERRQKALALARREELSSRQREELLQQQEELQAVNESLERQIEERTRVSERRARQLSLLASELTKAEERERRRLAQMLHDDLQQMLVAARMHITAITPDASPPRMLELIRHVDDLLDRSIRLSRNLTHRASPPVLYDAGLAPALEWLGRQVEEEHGLEVEVDCDDAAQPESQDTRILLYQACRELLFNVVKHAGTKRCKLAMHRAGNGDVQVSVCDEGKGFKEESSDEIGKSDGFGLFSIRERLELIGGRMEIESITGEGSCVRLYAPVMMSDEQRDHTQAHRTLVEVLEENSEPEQGSKPYSGTPIRVLLADDHRIIRASLAGLLRKQDGIEVVGQAGDGQEVIEKALSLKPDVIVMDVTMPVIDGLEATRRLMAEMPHLAVIGLSMHDKEDMQEAMRSAGAARYLTKDGPPELLIAAIQSSYRKLKKKAAHPIA